MKHAALAFALSCAVIAACNSGSPAQTDGGFDAANDVAIDAIDETNDAAIEAQDEGDGAVVVACGIASVWTTDIPNDLACTGLYSDFPNKVVDASALSYTPGLILWSDGATKQRWLYLPPNSPIDDSDMDEWTFPVGTKVWKEFQVNGQRVETRMFTKAANSQWLWTTYQWSSDGTTAVRNDVGAMNVVDTYEIPSHTECGQCHAGRYDMLMGFEAIALSLASAQGLTLDYLAKNGKLTQIPAHTTATLPEDATGKAATALGILHIDCGVSCHNQNGSANGSLSGLYLRLPAADVLAGTAVVTSLDSYTTTVNVTPTIATYHTYATEGYKRILPGNAAMSLIVTVANERGADQMPPIATHVVDATSVTSLEAWINAL